MRRGAYGNEKKAPIVDLSFYQATRHSFTSRNLAAGASLDEVSRPSLRLVQKLVQKWTSAPVAQKRKRPGTIVHSGLPRRFM